MDLRLPNSLKAGDTIGFFSPSSPATVFSPIRFQRAKSFLENKGFVLQEGALTGCSDYYRSGSIQKRAEELNALIRNPKVRCIMTTIGGNNSNALLPYIDYTALKSDPKIIIGYSDATALLLGIYAKTGLVTFYGPALVASFGEFPPLVNQTFQSFFELLCQPISAPYPYLMPPYWTDMMIDWETQSEAKLVNSNQWQFIGDGIVTGRVIGGNLNTMRAILGSDYMPKIKEGDVLLIEDSLHGIETIERSFAHLKLCGVFDKVSAIILGKHELFNNKGSGRQPLDVLKEVLNGQEIPILHGFDSCHTHPMLVMPLGVKVEINFDLQSISLVSSWLRT